MTQLFKTIATVWMLCLLTTAPSVQASDIITTVELREAAYAGQVDRVEEALVDAQTAFEAGEVTADEMRSLVMVLTVSHPKMADLTENWLRRYPQSPYAHIVQAWLFNDIAWNIRGSHTIGKTYPDSISSFYEWHRKALEHAEFAYEAAPRLIPASDAIIKFANGSGNRMTAFETLENVMTTDPNMGTLRRSLWLSAPGWGGSAQQAVRMCEAYAPGLPSMIDPVTECKLDAWTNHHWRDLAEWAFDVVGTTDNPDMAYYRMFGLQNSWGWSGIEDAQFSYDYLTRDGVVWRKAAETFDLNIPRKFGFPYIYEAHHRKAIARAREQLEHDPYNTSLIDDLRIRLIPDLHRNALGQPLKPDEVITLAPEEERELIQRQLVSSPYRSTLWWALWSHLKDEAEPHELIDLDPYLINAVVYSKHRMWELHTLMNQKKNQYDLVQDIQFGKIENDGYAVTEDVDNDITCPLIRAQRLYEKVCVATKDQHSSTCGYSKFQQADFDAIWADVKARGVCKKERFSPVLELSYSPVPVDLPAETGG